jgi:hypothetical protein
MRIAFDTGSRANDMRIAQALYIACRCRQNGIVIPAIKRRCFNSNIRDKEKNNLETDRSQIPEALLKPIGFR